MLERVISMFKRSNRSFPLVVCKYNRSIELTKECRALHYSTFARQSVTKLDDDRRDLEVKEIAKAKAVNKA
jgi:hypothetical protein